MRFLIGIFLISFCSFCRQKQEKATVFVKCENPIIPYDDPFIDILLTKKYSKIVGTIESDSLTEEKILYKFDPEKRLVYKKGFWQNDSLMYDSLNRLKEYKSYGCSNTHFLINYKIEGDSLIESWIQPWDKKAKLHKVYKLDKNCKIILKSNLDEWSYWLHSKYYYFNNKLVKVTSKKQIMLFNYEDDILINRVELVEKKLKEIDYYNREGLIDSCYVYQHDNRIVKARFKYIGFGVK